MLPYLSSYKKGNGSEYLDVLGHQRHTKDLRRKSLKKRRRSIKFNANKQASVRITFPRTIDHIVTKLKSEGNFVKPKFTYSYSPKIPQVFSITDNPKATFSFINRLVAVLYHQTAFYINIDYCDCRQLDIDAQITMDVILRDFIQTYKNYEKHGLVKILGVNATNFSAPDLQKILVSVGTPQVLKGIEVKHPGVIVYPLCSRGRGLKTDDLSASQYKDVDTTSLVSYVIECLEHLGQKLTPTRRSNLCQVIGEILINAEEHSTVPFRHSVGYFEQKVVKGKKCGVFRLAIFNFGQTIYEKFRDRNCPTPNIVNRMKNFSKKYTKKGFFTRRKFEEECLWCLYALQQGVTTKVNFRSRGNGSIEFLENFLSLKGDMNNNDDISRLHILSGNTKIIFDGSYRIAQPRRDDSSLKILSFNSLNTLEEPPDKNFVKFVPNYFPGTMITAKILISSNDTVPISRAS